MQFEQLLQQSGLTEPEKQELLEYLQENDLTSQIKQFCQNITHVSPSQQNDFEGLPFDIQTMPIDQINEQILELQQFHDETVENEDEINFARHLQQIADDLDELKPIQFSELQNTQKLQFQQNLNDLEQNQKTFQFQFNILSSKFDSVKSNMTAFSPDLSFILKQTQKELKQTILQSLEVLTKIDPNKQLTYWFNESMRLHKQICSLQYQELQLKQVLQAIDGKEFLIQKYNEFYHLPQQQLEAKLEEYNELIRQNSYLNQLFAESIQQQFTEELKEVLQEVFNQLLSQLDQSIAELNRCGDFVSQTALLLQLILKKLNEENNLFSAQTQNMKQFQQEMQKQNEIIQEILFYLQISQQKKQDILKSPLELLKIDKVFEALGCEKVAVVQDCLGFLAQKMTEKDEFKDSLIIKNQINEALFKLGQMIKEISQLGGDSVVDDIQAVIAEKEQLVNMK